MYIKAKHQRRIQMTLSLSDTIDAGIQTQTPLPLFVLLAILVSPKPTAECDAVYKFSRACILTGVRGVNGVRQAQAKFLLPDMNKLALEAKSGSLAILFLSFSGGQNSQFGIGSSNIHSGIFRGNCLWSKIPLESLYSSWQEYPNMDLGQKANSVSLVEMQRCFLQLKSTSEEKCIAIQVPGNPLTSSSQSPQQIKVTISAEKVGVPTEESPYSYSFSFNDIPSSSMIRLREGNVVFNYRYYNNKLQKTEVMQYFFCLFPIMFLGLECHMPSTHDLFNFEFWVNEEYQVVNVSLKSETMITEVSTCYFQNSILNEQLTFDTKKSRRKRQKSHVGNSRQGRHLGLGCETTLDYFKCLIASAPHRPNPTLELVLENVYVETVEPWPS
ncbi:hypothetical protein Bca52824_006361 [Brassica carinata]|uniref:Uncharacterized protein n=1 Tax=Brassica carinata TaxID=52824 RepID=A0A8X7WSZ0_BRACI|nr:hypothetical protein Bca52824_006361 [Brassica carinata]